LTSAPTKPTARTCDARKKSYNIATYEGFDSIHFGESRENARTKLGAYKEFRKTKFSKNTTDDFGDFHIFYDEENIVQAVEFFEGEVLLNNSKLLPNTKKGLFETLIKIDEKALSTPESVESKLLGVDAYAPGDIVEAVLIYRKGYYD